MVKHLSIVAALALAMGGLSLAGCHSDNDAPTDHTGTSAGVSGGTQSGSGTGNAAHDGTGTGTGAGNSASGGATSAKGESGGK